MLIYYIIQRRIEMGKIDKNTLKVLTIVLYLSIIIPFLYIVTTGSYTVNKIVLVISIFIASTSVRLFIMYPNPKYHQMSKIMLLIDLALIYWILLMDISGVSYLFLFVIIGDAVLVHDGPFSAGIAVLTYLTYAFTLYIQQGYPDMLVFVMELFKNSLIFITYYGILFIAKYQIEQRNKLQLTMEDLDRKTKELTRAYEKLKHSSEELEEMTIIEERNRIAREIHDTVGHTLTTVLVEIEAGKRLIDKNNDLAKEKLELAQGQVRNGLDNIRGSVRMLKKGEDVLDFIPSIISLINETMKHTEVQIEYEIEEGIEIPQTIGKSLYRILQEGITNGIKHGKATTFYLKIHTIQGENGRDIQLILKDNGIGTDSIIESFGLISIRERISKFGGNVVYYSEKGKGFTMEIEL